VAWRAIGCQDGDFVSMYEFTLETLRRAVMGVLSPWRRCRGYFFARRFVA
jgi:hypothetical protein